MAANVMKTAAVRIAKTRVHGDGHIHFDHLRPRGVKKQHEVDLSNVSMPEISAPHRVLGVGAPVRYTRRGVARMASLRFSRHASGDPQAPRPMMPKRVLRGRRKLRKYFRGMSMGSQCMATVATRAAMVASTPWASGFLDDLHFNTNGGFPRRSVSMPAAEVTHSLREALREAERKGTLEGGVDEDEGGRNHDFEELDEGAEAAPTAQPPAPKSGQAAASRSTAEAQSAANHSTAEAQPSASGGAPRAGGAAGDEGVGAAGSAIKTGSSFSGIFRSLLRSRSQGQPPMRASPLMPTDFIH